MLDDASESAIESNAQAVAIPVGDVLGWLASDDTLLPGAGATVTFNAAASPFYVSPPSGSFYNLAMTSFINAEGTVTPTANGFMIDNGGGSVHFAAPIPEPAAGAVPARRLWPQATPPSAKNAASTGSGP